MKNIVHAGQLPIKGRIVREIRNYDKFKFAAVIRQHTLQPRGRFAKADAQPIASLEGFDCGCAADKASGSGDEEQFVGHLVVSSVSREIV